MQIYSLRMNSSTSDSAQMPFLILSLNAAGLLVHPIIFGICLFNLAILFSTRILHPNLGFILIFQSICFSAFEISEFGVNIQQLFLPLNQEFYSIAFTIAVIIGYFGATAGHLLFLERIIATLMFRKYSKYSKPYFGILCCTLIIIYYSILVSANKLYLESSTVSFAIQLVLPIFSIFEFITIGHIGMNNLKIYNRQIHTIGADGYSLEQKYQFAENIRACKQLYPAFLCHFFQNIFGTVLFLLLKYNLASKQSLMTAGIYLASFFNLIIEVTIITHHPQLKSNCKKMLRKMALILKRKNNQISSEEGRNNPDFGTIELPARNHSLPRNILGNPLVMQNLSDQYFNMLQMSWDQKTTVNDN